MSTQYQTRPTTDGRSLSLSATGSSSPVADSLAETVQDERCGKCQRPGHLTQYGPGHDVLFARATSFDFHRYAPSPYMRRLWVLRKEVES